MTDRLVNRFAKDVADGGRDDRNYLGGKGANLAEMCRVGLPVPPGFTLPTTVAHQLEDGALTDTHKAAIREGIAFIEEQTGRKFGDPERPLLVSVRSGARVSMPGMMDTVLNLGLNRRIAEAWEAHDEPHLVWDAYRRLLAMYGDVVIGLGGDTNPFGAALDALKKKLGAKADLDLSIEELKGLCTTYEQILEDAAPGAFPTDPIAQLENAVAAVFRSWGTERARAYRAHQHIPEAWGTACNVQAMVFGDRSARSATGVCFTRDPSDGTPGLIGEALEAAQGEDVVAGVRTPLPIDAPDGEESLARAYPEQVKLLKEGAAKLEDHFKDLQDIEFTIDDGKLWFLQTRNGKRTAAAAVRIAVDLVDEGRIDQREALTRVDPDAIEALLRPSVSPEAAAAAAAEGRRIATGLAASPGTGQGHIALTTDDALALAKEGKTVILVRPETTADDMPAMTVAAAVLTARGGRTSHAAVVARGLGLPAVVGAEDLTVDLSAGTVTGGGHTLRRGDVICVDGGGGAAYVGELPTQGAAEDDNLHRLLGWADKVRRLKVRANADSPEAAAEAMKRGAEGIGLCRTEHMFFGPERVKVMQEMLLVEDDALRDAALAKLLPMQRADFDGMLRACSPHPVTIRLLDPPLHEFLPDTPEEEQEIADDLGIDVSRVHAAVDHHSELNPMLGLRGCRLAITFPAICRMQTRAIFEAACDVAADGVEVDLEIMVPLVNDRRELDAVADVIEDEAAKVMAERGRELAWRLGAMLELPRACLRAGDLAGRATFFSFGTNDLTQTTLGLSRDDAGSFLGAYVAQGIFAQDPFRHLDQSGVGELVRLGVERATAARADVICGACGEHGGDPQSIRFFHGAGLTYVSCSPFRIPGARLAAAQAALEDA
jgi:pyruvate,orthophosphate dikinase